MNGRIAVALLFGLIAAAPVYAQQIKVLEAETELTKGQYLTSRSGLFTVVVQHDGNVVKYFTPPGFPARISESNGHFATNTTNGDRLRMQMDGNLALYTSSNTWAWNSGTGGRPYDMGYHLVLDEVGGLYIHDAMHNTIKTLAVIDKGTGSSARFPYRQYDTGSCRESWSPPMTSGATALQWAMAQGTTIGYCNDIH